MIKYEKDNAERVSDSQRRRIVRMHSRTTAEENNSKSGRGGKSHSHDHRIIRKSVSIKSVRRSQAYSKSMTH